MRTTVYVASPLSGNMKRNLGYARMCMADSLDRGEAPYLPHLLYPQVLSDDNAVHRAKGMAAGSAVLARMEALALYLDLGLSGGMASERELAKKLGMRIEERFLCDMRRAIWQWLEQREPGQWVANWRESECRLVFGASETTFIDINLPHIQSFLQTPGTIYTNALPSGHVMPRLDAVGESLCAEAFAHWPAVLQACAELKLILAPLVRHVEAEEASCPF